MRSAPAQHDRRALVLMPLAALVAVLPLIVHGCSCGHDFDFHLLSWIETANQFSHGNLHPHWAYTPAFNAGEPRFVFYPPISWVLGALLGLVLTHLPSISEAAGWTAAPIVFTWIALTASGLTMHRLARAFTTRNAALLAAVLYLANPYMLFTAYERTAYGELLAAAWMPLLFLAILRARVTIAGIAIPLALLWLTNAPAGVMGSYAFALLATIRVLQPSADPGVRLQLALKALGGTALGLGLAAFYILPAAWERRYVQVHMALVTGVRIPDNTLFHRTGATQDQLFHDAVLHTASVVALLLLIPAAVALAALFIARKAAPSDAEHRTPFPTLPLAIFAAMIAFLLTPWSLSLWNHAPQSEFLQFPWRLLAVLAPIPALAIAAALERVRLNATATAAVALLAALGLTVPAYRIFHQYCDPEDTARARVALFHSNAGTDPTDEYTPAGDDNDALKTADPPYWLADSANASAPANAAPGPAPSHLAITAAHAEDLILNLRDYPAWRVLLNGAIDTQRQHRNDGLIALAVPPGTSTIDIRYVRMPDQTVGGGVTLLALALLLLSLRTDLRVRRVD